MILIGKINSINETKGTVNVLFPDRENLVVDELKLFKNEYRIPHVGSTVLCLFLSNTLEEGFCLGEFNSNLNLPIFSNKNIISYIFDDKTFLKFNNTTKQLEIISENPVNFNGNIIVNGTVTATDFIRGGNS